jgi:hypothetical protein
MTPRRSSPPRRASRSTTPAHRTRPPSRAPTSAPYTNATPSPIRARRPRARHPFAQTPAGGQRSSFWAGWHGYLDKDLRALLGRPVASPLSRAYCGGGSLDACRAVLTDMLAAAADDVRAQYGTSLDGVRAHATGCEDEPVCDQISYVTAGAVDTPPIPWQDRPTFQQVVEIRR